MSEKSTVTTQSAKVKLFIIIGYVILIILATYGVFRVYSELRIFSEYESPFEERKELILVSNTLANLYESESMSRVLLINPAQKEEYKIYDSLVSHIYIQLDSLRRISSDEIIHSHIDTVSVLLVKKYENTHRIFQLMDSINTIPLQKKTMTTVLSKKDIENLDQIYKYHTRDVTNKTVAQVKKKSFTKRLSDVFRAQVVDSVTYKSNVETDLTDSIMPIDSFTDTLVHYVTDVMLQYDKKRNAYITQLAIRQNDMFLTNGNLTTQINYILRDVEFREYKKSTEFLREKEKTLSKSSKIAFRVALAALVTAIIFLILSMKSLSREQKYRKQLENAKQYAEDLLQSRERLMLTISHDIKTPLSSIIGYIELLTKSKLPTKEKYYLANMQSSSEQVLELVTKLLDYHRLESGSPEINQMRFSPSRLLNDIYQSFLPLIERKGLEFEFLNELDPNEFYQSDPFRIRQIINNLLSNAIKFTEKGKISLYASILSARNGYVLNVTVKDTGCGIVRGERGRIFEEFARVKNSDTQGIEGSGLGLAISRKLAMLLKGNIHVESEENVGSEFTVNIPLDDYENTTNIKVENIDKKKIRILFIDDDLVLLNMYKELLSREGFYPVVCSNSLDALRLLQRTHFDIIFSDIQMPDMNGFELVERIRNGIYAGVKDVPVIALSAHSNISNQKFKEAGFSDFLEKPIKPEYLIDTIVRHTGILKKKEIIHNTEGFYALTAFAGKDIDAARNILKMFIKENFEISKKIEESIQLENWNDIRTYAHKLLPLMRMIGAEAAVSILYDLENNVRDKDEVHTLIKILKQKRKEAESFLKNIHSL